MFHYENQSELKSIKKRETLRYVENIEDLLKHNQNLQINQPQTDWNYRSCT